MNKWTFSVIFAGIGLLFSNAAMAQGDLGTGSGDTGGTTTAPTQNTGGGGGNTQTQVGGSQQIGQAGRVEGENIVQPEVAVPENVRIQPFVGKNEGNYYHDYSLYNNNGLGANGQGGGGRAAGGGRGGGGSQMFFDVTRRSIRTRVRPAFTSPKIPNAARSANYNNRLSKIPGMANASQTVRLQVQGRVGRLSGTVNSAAQKAMIERQVRLEPGVYSIVNEIRVVGN